jgi:outer membrane protein TolC
MNIKALIRLLPGRTLLLLLFSPALYGQEVLDRYIREGLTNNQVLQQRNISLEQAEDALKIARSYFLPSVTLMGDYTSGEGGRSINLPIGDLLNPVYGSLNQLTGSDAFPQVENVNQNFFPYNFYDAKVRTSVPLLNTDLYVNRSIQSQRVALQQHEVDSYRRQLVFDIKSAYFNYLSAVEAVKIYESALILVQRNVAVNESLTRNGKGLPANLLRSRSEEERVKADLNSARNRSDNARKYVNFLLNRDLGSPVEESTPEVGSLTTDSLSHDISEREELEMLRIAREISQSTIRMSQLNRVPKVNAFLDLGSQASNWEYNSDSRYYLVGVQLTLPLFQGFRNNTTIHQHKLELRKSELSLSHTTRQLQLAADVARNDLQVTLDNLTAAKEQLRSAQSYFNLIDKGYQQGVNSLIEYLDARNQLTASQLQQNLRSFEVLIAWARVERETASYPLEK